jgi:hypothetical protein
MTVLKEGEIVHVITRRQFEKDAIRHFVGEVKAASDTVARVRGYLFVYDMVKGHFVRRRNPRVRIVPLADSGTIVNVLPNNVDPDSLTYEIGDEEQLVLTDKKAFTYNLNEFRYHDGLGR